MENLENQTNGVTTENPSGTEEFDVLGELKKLKENSVDKSLYLKEKAEKEKYQKALLNGDGLGYTDNKKQEPEISTDELRKKVFQPRQSNLEFWKNTLAFRERILNEQGTDIFVPKSLNSTPTSTDYELAQTVADTMQSCVDTANGDPAVFNTEYTRLVKNSQPGIDPRIKR